MFAKQCSSFALDAACDTTICLCAVHFVHTLRFFFPLLAQPCILRGHWMWCTLHPKWQDILWADS